MNRLRRKKLEDIGFIVFIHTKERTRLFIMFKDYLKKTYPIYLLISCLSSVKLLFLLFVKLW